MTCVCIVCITFARNCSLFAIRPYFHISFITRLMRLAGNNISLAAAGSVRRGAGIFRPRIRVSKTSSSSRLVSSMSLIFSSAGSPRLIALFLTSIFRSSVEVIGVCIGRDCPAEPCRGGRWGEGAFSWAPSVSSDRRVVVLNVDISRSLSIGWERDRLRCSN